MKSVLIISARDNVATALEPLDAGHALQLDDSRVLVRDDVPAGHKVAIAAIRAGSPVIKYGSEIGTATADIPAGAHVHTHNVASARGRGDLSPTALSTGASTPLSTHAAPEASSWSNE